MSQADTTTIDDALELAKLLRPTWPAIDARLHATGVPLCEGDGGDGGDGADGGDGDGGGNDPETFDRDYVTKLRREAAGHRKEARDAQARLKEIEKEGLSEAEKLKKEAEDGRALATTGTTKLRTANLVLALAEKGLPGNRAKAAAKLLDGVEYDDSDEPKNLDDAIKAAAEVYGQDMFGGQAPQRTTFDGGARQQQGRRTTGGDMDAAIRAAAGRG